LTSWLTVVDYSVLQIKMVICHTVDSKPVKEEVNGTVILPPLVFPVLSIMEITTHTFVKFVWGTYCSIFANHANRRERLLIKVACYV